MPRATPSAARAPIPWDVLGVIALGGMVGGMARWLLNEAVAPSARGFPWSTFLENVSGSFLIGLLMVFLLEVWPPGRYRRPFLAVGVLGGFTTFSTFTNDVRALLMDARPGLAAAYVMGTLAAGLAAVSGGLLTGRAIARAGTTTPGRGGAAPGDDEERGDR